MQPLSSDRSFFYSVGVARNTAATPQQGARVVVCYAENLPAITVQRNYRLVCEGDAPDTKTTKAWFGKFLATVE
jgi:hypothetical protein